MRRFWLFFLTMILVISLQAQDIIVLRDSSKIKAKVLSVSDSCVNYKKWNNLEGPVYSTNVERVSNIRYEDGTVTTNRVLRNPRPFIKKTRFQSYLSFGVWYYPDFDGIVFLDGFACTWSFGARIFDYGYAGLKVGVGFRGYIDFPIQFDFRGYYPINRKIHPYIEFSPGVMLYFDSPLKYSVIHQLGVGFDISHYSFGFGYHRGHVVDGYSVIPSDFFYVKIGVKFGKNH